MSEKSYKVGKGKPPTKSQFKKGRSGNQSGRPKGRKNFKTRFNEVLELLDMPPSQLKKLNLDSDSTLKVIAGKAAIAAIQGDPRNLGELINILTKLKTYFSDVEDGGGKEDYR
jgi:hypothetical protein